MLSRPVLILCPLLFLYLAIVLLTPPSATPFRDEAEYLDFAKNLTQGYYSPTTASDVDLWFGPGLPIVLAPLVALGASLTVLRLVGPLLLFFMVVMFYRLLRLYTRPRVALGCAYALGLYFPFFIVLRTVHSEPLVLFLIVTWMYMSVRYLRDGGRHFLIVGGIALGWVALTRLAFGWVVAIVLLIFVILSVVFRHRVALRRSAFIYTIALVICVPWLLYTFSLSGHIFYWGNSGGLSLYWISSTNTQNLGDWFSFQSVFIRPELASHRPLFETLTQLDPIARDVALQNAAINNIRSNPIKFLQNVFANISRLWFSFPFSFTQQKLTTLFYLIPNSFILMLLILCIPVLFIKRRAVKPEAVSFILFAGAGFGLHALLSAYARMLLPIIPMLLWLIFYTFTNHIQIKLIAGQAVMSTPPNLVTAYISSADKPDLEVESL